MTVLFADTADFDSIVIASKNPQIMGFTTNPTLMKQAGVTDYSEFSKKTISYLKENRPDTCLSLEVFADDFDEMDRQAHIIDSWSKDADYPVYIKIPVVNTKGEGNYRLISKLSFANLKLNITAVFTYEQIKETFESINEKIPLIISIFAGRIADAGLNPEPFIKKAIFWRNCYSLSQVKILWASTREVYNYTQAMDCDCDIITVTPDIIKKLGNIGKDLTEFSRETVQMFYDDGKKSGFKI